VRKEDLKLKDESLKSLINLVRRLCGQPELDEVNLEAIAGKDKSLWYDSLPVQILIHDQLTIRDDYCQVMKASLKYHQE
jgi:hypothetical protein